LRGKNWYTVQPIIICTAFCLNTFAGRAGIVVFIFCF
jgi:hypothetical protein